VDQLNAIRGKQKVGQIPMREIELGGQNVELAMAEVARDETGAAGGRAGGRNLVLAKRGRRDGYEYGARQPGKMVGKEREFAPAVAPRPAAAPTTRPSGGLPKAVTGISEPPAFRDADKKDADGLFAAWYDRSQRFADNGRKLPPSEAVASQPVIAQAQPAPPAPGIVAPGAQFEYSNGALRAVAPQRGPVVRSMFRQGHATTFAAAHLRQFVVILNGVAAEAGE
jgi:hypothetical protein